MKKKDIKELPKEELLKKRKHLKVVTGLLAGILIALFALTLYNTFKDGSFDPLLITAIALAVIIPINLKQLKTINKELANRA